MFGSSSLLILLCGAGYTYAAVALFTAEERPAEFADQEGCYLRHLNKVIPYGEYYPNNSCSKYSCYTTNMTQLVTCGVAVINEKSPCKLISDGTQKYPDCCPKIMCSTIPPGATSGTTDLPVIDAGAKSATKETLKTENLTTTETVPGTSDHETPATSETSVLKALPTNEAIKAVHEETLNELLIAQATIHN